MAPPRARVGLLLLFLTACSCYIKPSLAYNYMRDYHNIRVIR